MLHIPKLFIGSRFTDSFCLFGLAAASAIAAGATIAAAAGQSIAASNLNGRNRRWQANQNQISRDWNAQQAQISRDWQQRMYETYDTPLAQRRQIEEAGYNPYLLTPEGTTFQGGSAAAPPSSTPATLPQQFNPLEGLSGMASNFGALITSLANAKSSTATADNTSYQTQRQKEIDAVQEGGTSALQAEGLQKIYESEQMYQAANKTAAESAIEDIHASWLNAQAIDSNNQPVVNDDGSPVTNYEYEQRGNQANIWKGYDKLVQDINESVERVANLKVDELTKKYNLDELMPAQKSEILTRIKKLQSDIEVNKHQAVALDASAYSSYASGVNAYSMADYNRSLTTTENMLRPSKLGLNDWQVEALKRQSQLTMQQTSLAKENTRKASHDWNSFGPSFGVNTSFSPNDFGMIKFSKKVKPGFKTYSAPKSRFLRFFKFFK